MVMSGGIVGPSAAAAEANVPRHRRLKLSALAVAGLALLQAAGQPLPASAQAVDKPYDDRLMRLSEILGAVHYLRELCGANEGQAWRERMRELLEAEGANALRRARLTRSFNQGYHSYSKTHKICTSTAQTAINRFMSEGVQIAENLVKSIP